MGLTNSELQDYMKFDFIPVLEEALPRLYGKDFVILGDCYNYKCLNKKMTKWETDDGAILDEGLFDLLWEYVDPYFIEVDPDYFVENNTMSLKQFKEYQKQGY